MTQGIWDMAVRVYGKAVIVIATAYTVFSALIVVASPRQQVIQAKPGEIASGVVVYQSEVEIRVKTQPCEGRDIVSFRAPFRKTVIGSVVCGGQTLERVEVEKK